MPPAVLIWETHSAILAQLVKMNVVNPLKMISVANAIMDGVFRKHFMCHDIFFYFIIHGMNRNFQICLIFKVWRWEKLSSKWNTSKS